MQAAGTHGCISPGNLQEKQRGRWLLFPRGHGKGLLYFNRCRGGQGAFLRHILFQRLAGARPVAPSALRAAMAEGPAPSSGL